MNGLDAVIGAIRNARRIALLLHVSPDGDTCGSALALRRALLFAGKEVAVCCEHPVPYICNDLDGAETVARPDSLAGERFDLAIAVDVGDRGRLGKAEPIFHAAARTAQVDHHETNPGYAEANFIRSPLSATGVLVAELIDALGAPFDLPTAKCLFVAASTDTGNFSHRNTDPDALRLAARCVEVGIDTAAITRRVYDLLPLAQTKLIGRALTSLQTLCGGRAAIMRLSKADYDACGAHSEHTEGIINYGINTIGVEMACILSERRDAIRCSLRALPPHDVAAICARFGGGGHKLAAGCTFTGSFEEACATMERAITEAL